MHLYLITQLTPTAPTLKDIHRKTQSESSDTNNKMAAR